MSAAIGRTFSSLSVPNYRRYFAGQLASISGNWMQTVAEMWLMVKLTGSGAAVGLTAGLQFLPILLFGAWGGLLADRIPKRRLLSFTQPAMAVPALTLWVLTGTGHVAAWMVLGLVLVRGSVNALDNPARQAFVVEMVGADRVVNAVALNSVIVHSSRIIGPAAAGAVIALLGVGPCFLINGLSFFVMLAALRTMNPRALLAPRVAERRGGELRSALRYVARTPELRVPLLMMAVVGTISFNFQVLLPLLADFTWHGSASTYAALTAAMGVGSVAGALAAGARGRVTPRLIVAASMIFGVSELFVAAAPTLPIQLLFLVPLGAASVTFAAGINSSLQIAVEPAMRGRVMALYSVVFLGSTPIGSPLVGWLAGVAGPRAGLLAGAIAAVIAAVGARYAYGRLAARAAPSPASVVAGEPATASPEPAPMSARARAHAGRVRTRLSSAVARERA
ncbi:MFS transporter [Candidatus Solirubrobacter pratensis]|uniref:MFS transporter n=1 Tax=Candidatus Solirubrobacter pratensis TaxID=1298857 RepID=UPI000413D7B7|nr:MFS transporter [Candidatus Solirubrobacter pratensis]